MQQHSKDAFDRDTLALSHIQRSPVSYDIELLKVAATYSPTTQCSTIGDAELNDPVRNGKGWDLSAITT